MLINVKHKTVTRTLRNVFFVPMLSNNSLSVSVMARVGLENAFKAFLVTLPKKTDASHMDHYVTSIHSLITAN